MGNIQQNHVPCEEQLYDTTWRLEMYDNETITLKYPATIRFEKSGRISGFSGCNQYFGKSELTSTTISFGPIGSTRKYCMGPQGDLERKLFTMFHGTKWWNFDEEGHLQIFDDEHRLIFSKEQ
ncbi:META domain-containing protein [Hydrogenimonas sp.]|uniref:META domain-containing protein n=1 Tax=Hydrogenimonas sp. TaxID=2231112 RepID=UPI0026030333|nr:META domain-containing protein [Hydrogenimonas sp.]